MPRGHLSVSQFDFLILRPDRNRGAVAKQAPREEELNPRLAGRSPCKIPLVDRLTVCYHSSTHQPQFLLGMGSAIRGTLNEAGSDDASLDPERRAPVDEILDHELE